MKSSHKRIKKALKKRSKAEVEKHFLVRLDIIGVSVKEAG